MYLSVISLSGLEGANRGKSRTFFSTKFLFLSGNYILVYSDALYSTGLTVGSKTSFVPDRTAGKLGLLISG